MVRSKKHKVLSKVLYAESPVLVNTAGFFDFGDTENSKIFKYLSDLLIEYLGRDSPLETKYLTSLTHCMHMVVITRSCILDEELYVLEDFVLQLCGFSRRKRMIRK